MAQLSLNLDLPDDKDLEKKMDEIANAVATENTTLKYHVDRGMQGLNKGFSNGLGERTNKLLYGTHRATYYLFGADSGIGKTTMADFMFVYSLIKDCEIKKVPFQIDYYSFEIPTVMKKAKWASLLYYIKHRLNLPAQYILGRDMKKIMTKEEYANMQAVQDEIEHMFSKINFIEDSTRPLQLWGRVLDRANANGVLHHNEKGQLVGYTPNNPQMIRFTIVDHLALIDSEPGLDLKRSMDLVSKLAVRARNILGDSFCFIQQFNSEMQSAARERKSVMAYVPSRQDFGDTKYTFRDADVVLGLCRPVDFQLNEFGPYTELGQWGQYFILMYVMKNRYGQGALPVPIFMNPIAGIPEELPEDWNTLTQDMYIEHAKKLDAVNQ